MGEHSKRILFSALMVFVFGATACPLWAAGSEWASLHVLKPDELIRVELNDAKTCDGAFLAMNDKGITLRRAAGEQTFARLDIRRVLRMTKSHHFRNALIGTGIGAVLAAPLIAAITRNQRQGLDEIALLFLPVGTLIGAKIPSGGWREVYRAH